MDVQRILSSLNCDLLLSEITKFNGEDDSSSASDEEINITENKTKDQKNISYGNITKHQQFIKDLLEESSDSNEEEISVEEQLHVHKILEKYRHSAKLNDNYKKYMHFSCDVLTGEDQWITHYQTIPKKKFGHKGSKKMSKTENDDLSFFENLENDETISSEKLRMTLKNISNRKRKSNGSRKLVDISVIRKNVWKNIAKKEIPKAYRQRCQNQVSKFTLLKKVSKEGAKYVRRKALFSYNISRREVKISLARRLTREAAIYWKKFDKEEKNKKKQAEKEAIVQRKLDEVFKETCEQHKKLNFLITRTELFAHVISKKINKNFVKDEELWNTEKQRILSQLVIPESSPYSSRLNEYCDVVDQEDCSAETLLENVESACTLQETKTKEFATSHTNDDKVNAAETSLLNGQLKGYQVKGVQWLASLYSNGLNGILADDMGLGKTVQTIAFLAHLAEHNQIWGPFLVVAPASTLNNWHQEFARFLPGFKVLPYWGNTTERKVLRLFWNKNTKFQPETKSPFHVLVTSYQLVISDFRYFQQIPWEYLVLDEAQALKSSNSQRWKALLDFNCRNRLLLTGTPVQNTMAELWALLHFIMPTLFDNHAEFNEWFSKNIENHAENKSNVNTADLSRLHMILKPFMLRRVKSEVEHELTDKIEIRMLCHLAPRQRLLYDALQKNITVNDLMRVTSTSAQANSNNILMNLVMQFRKMCNHPDLFKANYNLTKFYFHPRPYNISRLIYHQFLSRRFYHSKAKILYSDFNVHTPKNVHRSLSEIGVQSCFSFLPFINLSLNEYFHIFSCSFFERLCNAERAKSKTKNRLWHILYSASSKIKKQSFHMWACKCFNCNKLSIKFHLIQDCIRFLSDKESIMSNLLFTQNCKNFLSNLDCTITAIVKESCSSTNIKNGQSRREVVCTQHCVPTSIPTILSSVYFPNVYSLPSHIYCNDNHALNKLHYLSSELNKFNKICQNVPHFTPIRCPDRDQLVVDSGKLQALDILLRRLKDEGHRVLIYSQMTKMIDILEEYLILKSHTYVRLDGSSRISSRRDAVAGFQSRDDIFVFLLSTRAGGLGINLTAADTVIFYDSDWNPAVDQQAMDRAHRLGQTKQVTVYRLVCSGTVDERILERAEAKRTIQRLVISGATSKVDSLKPKEVYTLLLDDNQISNNPSLVGPENSPLTKKKERIGKKRGRKPKLQKAVLPISQANDEDEHIIVVDDNLTTNTSTVLTKNQNISDIPVQGFSDIAKSSTSSKLAKRRISTPLNTDSTKKRRGRKSFANKATSSKF